jgi:hypothetical protein
MKLYQKEIVLSFLPKYLEMGGVSDSINLPPEVALV